MKNVSIVALIAIFIFFATVSVGVGIATVPQAHAYAVGSVPTTTNSGAPTTAGSTSYDFGSSLQNLVSPFTNFFQSLQWSNNSSINTNGTPGATWPVVNFTPVVAGTIQSWLTTWFTEFDNWFYHLTGIQLSGIVFAILNIFSWVLGLAQQVVNWLLGLFHQK